MTVARFLADLLEREAGPSRRLLERVPEGRGDWKPHEKSMPLGYLASLVATMPGWAAMMVSQDELDLRPPSGPAYAPPDTGSAAALRRAHEDAVAQARAALQSTDDAHLRTRWRLLVGGQVVAEDTRANMIADTFTHLAHHRGQLSVYLRLLGVALPSIYGPSADDRTF